MKRKGHTSRPNKRLGQHFLRDREVIRELINLADFKKTDRVLEVGPGLGALTIPLAGYVHEIIGVEKDSRLADTLENNLLKSGITNVTLIKDDILKLDLKKVVGPYENKIKVIGNLPYNISSPFLEKLIYHRDLINKAVLMFQFEFANRLIASPGGKDYGAITILTHYHAAVSPLLEVSKNSFYPKPKVGSMVVVIDMQSPYSKRAEDEAVFKMVVKGAFAYRRKTVYNSLKGSLTSYGGDEISAALERSSIDSMRRAETINIDEFLRLASELEI
jgi:16S rRNA (adenine1518-N6/adenine1519-N6)-dimethyltransferase